MAEFWFRLAQHVEEAEAVDPSQNLKTTAKNQNIRQLRR
jgi:hypothetical protein